ncbi:MAG TPA: TonB-dependent receptor [Bacteroidetes bacterium]|nr:TonB-dependent receptor [Bacteroidota bacterium]
MFTFKLLEIKLLDIHFDLQKPSGTARAAYRILLLASFLFFFSKTNGQSVLDQKASLSVSNKSIPQALKKLGKSAGVELAFSERFFKKNKAAGGAAQKVSLNEKDQPIGYILDVLLKNTRVKYKEIDGQIVLFMGPKPKPRKRTLSGYIEDAASGERLIAAAVYCKELSLGTVTNEYGFYSLTLPENTAAVTASYLGYRETEIQLDKEQGRFINIQMQPSLTLAEIIVTPELEKDKLLPSPGEGTQLLNEQFEAAPDLGGESDLMRVAQMLPSVQTGAEGYGGLHVRGGNADQNLVLLDGVPVYNPDHLLGIFSVFNTEIVKSAKFFQSGFPARYGGQLSSVFDVRTREGNNKRWHGGLSAGLISLNGFLEAPFAKGKGSILVTGRSTHSNFLLKDVVKKILLPFDEPVSTYLFYDFNTKLSYRFSENDRVYLSYYRGKDYIKNSSEDIFYQEPIADSFAVESTFDFLMDWGNTISSLRWNHVFSPKLFANATLTYSKFKFSADILETSSTLLNGVDLGEESFVYIGLKSKNRDLAARIDFDFAPNRRHFVRFGAAYTAHRFQPINQIEDQSTFTDFGDVNDLNFDDFIKDIRFSYYADELSAYVEDEFKLGEKWHFNTGLRFSTFYSNKRFVNIEPRLSGRYQLDKRSSLTASLTRTTQYLSRIQYGEVNLPIDYWFPASKVLDPQKSWQYSIGGEVNIMEGLSFRTEAYYKDMKNLQAAPNAAEGPIEIEGVEYILADGRSFGTEFFLQKTNGKTGGWLSYSLSKSDREIGEQGQEEWLASRFDRRHGFKVFLYQRLGKHWQLSGNWVFGSGMPLLLGEIYPEDPPFFNRPLQRAPAYHRLDAALSFSIKKSKTEHTFKVSVYNAYGRKNPAFYLRKFLTPTELTPVYLLGILPGLHYGINF